jgi:hypothetical protein
MVNITAKLNGFRHTAIAIACAVILAGALTHKLAASEWDKKTIVTFNTPVEIPGNKDLPAGTYVFKRLDSPADRNIVQIWDKDEKQLFATVLAIPDYRLTPADKPVIQFDERPSDSPPALKAWFYPGDNYGLQFVYTQDRATQLAKRTNQHVLSMPNEMAQHSTASSSSATSPNVQALEKTHVTAIHPSGKQVSMDQAVSTKPVGPDKPDK